MIKLTKTSEPEVLAQNKQAWTDEFLVNRRSRRYSHPEIKSALEHETCGKCAYCESKMNHVSFAEIEHILPKSEVPGQVCEWANLTLVCERCNRKKLDYYDSECPLVNPYIDNPDDHLYWNGPLPLARTEDRGKITIEKLGLDDMDIIYKRSEKLKKIYDVIRRIESGPNHIAIALKEELKNLLKDSSEYAAASRQTVLRCLPSFFD